MAGSLPVVCVFGIKEISLKSSESIPQFETDELDCRCYLTDDNFGTILASDRPVAIVSIGDIKQFSNLMYAAWDVRRKWIHFTNIADINECGRRAFDCFILDSLRDRTPNEPLISVFTPTYKTGERILRPYQSLKCQTHKHWEWVIVDDSDDNGETWKMLQNLAEHDHRIRVYKEHRHSGNIGRLKRTACDLAYGEILLELDHDDALTFTALNDIANAFSNYQDVGFVYTDFAELYEDGTPVRYSDGWGLGYGSYRDEVYNGQVFAVANSPSINPKTIRHIVGVPNHARAWRKNFYQQIGGHNINFHVADDYEILIRTFLNTKMCRIPKLCYLQFRNFTEGNTHSIRNKEIQRLVRYISEYYNKQINERFVELGIDDFIYKGNVHFWSLGNAPKPTIEQHCTLIS